MTLTRTELDVFSVADLRVAAYSPADDDTRDRLPSHPARPAPLTTLPAPDGRAGSSAA